MPRVSIITLCHNQAQWIPECIASVGAQTYRDFEHVVIDVNSRVPVACGLRLGNTNTWTLSYEWTLPYDPGIASSRAFGVNRSSGDLIVQLDADDRIHPQFLEKLVTLAWRGAIVCPGLEEFGGRRGFCGIPKESEVGLDTFRHRNPIYCCSMYSRADYEAVGGYDPHLDFLGAEDYDLWYSMVAAGCQVKIVPEILFYYRVHKGSLTERLRDKAAEAHSYIWQKHSGAA